MAQWLFLIPLLSAFAGWLINRVAGTFFIKTYLPRQDKALAKKAGKLAAQYFNNKLNIQDKISDPRLIEKAMPSIEKHIDEFLNVKLQQEIPMLAMFVGNKTTDKIKEVFINQLRVLFPQVMLQISENLRADLDIEQILTNQLTQTPVSVLVKPETAQILRKLSQLGLLTGFLIGLLNLLLVWIAFQ